MKGSALFISLLTLMGGFAPAHAVEEVNLYSGRKEALIRPLLDKFTSETGIRVNLLSAEDDALLKRIQSEGRNTPADVLITSDAGRLYRARAAGLTQPIGSARVTLAVPAQYRDPYDHWVGLSVRARPVMYAPDRVDPATLSTYEDLADPAWKGRICIRSSDNIYNQSLVASMIEVYGVEKTEDWARGIVANMARPPQGGDRDQIKAVAAGQCDIAIANTYYLAGMLASDSPAEKVPAEKVRVFWPNQADRGVHVNVSGAVLVRDAKHADNARKLIEYLTGAKAQSWYAEVNGEYPVIADGSISDVLRDFGTFRADSLNLDKLGEHNAEAVRLMDRAGWK